METRRNKCLSVWLMRKAVAVEMVLDVLSVWLSVLMIHYRNAIYDFLQMTVCRYIPFSPCDRRFFAGPWTFRYGLSISLAHAVENTPPIRFRFSRGKKMRIPHSNPRRNKTQPRKKLPSIHTLSLTHSLRGKWWRCSRGAFVGRGCFWEKSVLGFAAIIFNWRDMLF